MTCRNCDPNYFTLTVYRKKDGTLILHEAKHSPAMDMLWDRISKAVNNHSYHSTLAGLNPERVRVLVEATKKYFQWLDDWKSTPIAEGSFRREQMRTALAAVRLK